MLSLSNSQLHFLLLYLSLPLSPLVPPPQVQLTELDRPDHGILYSGLNLTLRCSVNVSELGAGFVIVSVHWLKDGASLRDCSQLKRESDTLYYCQLTLTHLSHISSSGSYSCRAVLTPKTDYPLLKSRSSTSDNINLNIASKIIIIKILQWSEFS